MKKILPVLIIFIGSLIISTAVGEEEGFSYVGAAKCQMCHKSEKSGMQYPIWKESRHSQSFPTLTSEKAMAIASDAPDNPECLKCHSPLFEKAPDFKEEGVSCEVCHGPGSAYKKLTIMKSHDESVKNGLTEYTSMEDIKTLCLTCHADAHDNPFDFEAAWEKIKHPVPEKD
jgi:hypothetical protein